MSAGDKIAAWQKELKELNQELTILNDTVVSFNRRRKKIEGRQRELKNLLVQIKPEKIMVSDHAVLRYLERNHGIDVESVRAEIQSALDKAKDMGDLKIFGFVIKGNTVVTYAPSGGAA